MSKPLSDKRLAEIRNYRGYGTGKGGTEAVYIAELLAEVWRLRRKVDELENTEGAS